MVLMEERAGWSVFGSCCHDWIRTLSQAIGLEVFRQGKKGANGLGRFASANTQRRQKAIAAAGRLQVASGLRALAPPGATNVLELGGAGPQPGSRSSGPTGFSAASSVADGGPIERRTVGQGTAAITPVLAKRMQRRVVASVRAAVAPEHVKR